MRLVLDTASFLAGIRSSAGGAAEVIRLALLGRFVLLMDHNLSLEYRSAGLRPEHLEASRQTAARVLIVIENLESVAEPLSIIVKPRPLSSDPNDDMILDLAINGGADVIVTQNKKHFVEAAKRFGIRVLTPAEFLKQLKGKE